MSDPVAEALADVVIAADRLLRAGQGAGRGDVQLGAVAITGIATALRDGTADEPTLRAVLVIIAGMVRERGS